MKLTGLYTAMITPFKGDKIDFDGFQSNLHRQIAAGVDGVTILGTTGECATLTEEEQESLIRLTVEQGKEQVHIMVGTGGNSTRGVIHRTLIAKALGADSALVVSPYYNKPTQRGIYEHYKAVAEAAELPILVYNNPSRTSVNIDPLTLREILDLPHIAGVKEASASLSQINDVLHLLCDASPECTILSGNDADTFSIMALGGHGAISTLGNLCPHLLVELVQHLERGDWQAARSLHFQLLPLVKGIFLETNPIPIKAAMSHIGLPAGPCRLPLTEMGEAHRQALIRLIEDCELLKATT